MAGYGWSLRHGNSHDQPQRPTHIACRICDRVFMNAQALIDHIESHMAEDRIGAATPRNRNPLPYQSLRGSLSNPFQLTLSPPQPSPVSKPLYTFKSFQNPNYFNLGFNPTRVAKRPVNVTRPPFYLMGKKFTTKGPRGPYFLEAQDYRVMETRYEDLTRPFLQQLDKPISHMSELKRIDDDNDHNSADLDLSLKL